MPDIDSYLAPEQRRVDRPREDLPTVWQLLDHADVMDERVAKLEAECAELLDRLDRAGRVVDLMSLCHACQRNYEAAEAEAFGYGGERSELDR